VNGRKPRKLNYAEAAALPLTALTVWEGIVDHAGLREGLAGANQGISIIYQ
jgi:hypothetical protein